MRTSRRAFLGAIAGLAAGDLVTSGCKAKPTPSGDSRPAGAKPARRIVSISPSTTEAVWALGAIGRLVGRSRYCNFPKEVERLPQVGGYVDPNLEAILALAPDLVVGARGPIGTKLTDALGAHAISVYFPRTESLAEIDAMLLGLGDHLGLADAAKGEVARLHTEIDSVKARAEARPRRRTLLVFGLQPIVVAGPRSFADELLRLAGGINVVAEGDAYPTLGFERVLALDPDVVVNAAMAEERAIARISKDDPVWGKMRAVREGRVASITDESVLRPGPRVGQGLAALHAGLHGGA